MDIPEMVHNVQVFKVFSEVANLHFIIMISLKNKLIFVDTLSKIYLTVKT